MSKRRYNIKVTSFAELAIVYPLAVTEEVIPAKTVQKANYAYISKLLDCQIAVPGVEVIPEEPQVIVPPQAGADPTTMPPEGHVFTESSTAAIKPVLPAFLGKKHG